MIALKLTETDEQAELVRLLRKARLFCFSVPNGAKLAGNRKERVLLMQKLKREGLMPGAPDLLLFDPRSVGQITKPDGVAPEKVPRKGSTLTATGFLARWTSHGRLNALAANGAAARRRTNFRYDKTE